MSTNKFSKENKIGRAINTLRKQHKITLKELSERIDSSPGYLSEVERGLKKPGIELVQSLLREFKLDANDFMQGKISTENKETENADYINEPGVEYSSLEKKLSNWASETIEALETSPITKEAKIKIANTIIRILNNQLDS